MKRAEPGTLRAALLFPLFEADRSFSAFEADDNVRWKYTILADVLSDSLQPTFLDHSLVGVYIARFSFGAMRYISNL